jgi:hypothetical protein
LALSKLYIAYSSRRCTAKGEFLICTTSCYRVVVNSGKWNYILKNLLLRAAVTVDSMVVWLGTTEHPILCSYFLYFTKQLNKSYFETNIQVKKIFFKKYNLNTIIIININFVTTIIENKQLLYGCYKINIQK